MRTGWVTGMLLAVALIPLLAVPGLRQELVLQVKTPLVFRFEVVPQLSEVGGVARAHPADREVWLGYAESVRYVSGRFAKLRHDAVLRPQENQMLAQHFQGDIDLPGQFPQVQAAEQALNRAIGVARIRYWAAPRVWVDAQLARWVEAPAEDAVEETFGEALEVGPEWTAIGLRHALDHLERAGLAPLTYQRSGAPPPAAAEKVRSVRRARELLLECRRQAPENAACDYLLAWTYFADGRDDRGFEVLRGALGKRQWSLYESEAAQALLRCWDELELPAGFRAPSSVAVSALRSAETRAVLRALAENLVREADLSRDAGDHREAVLCYEAVAQMGHLMREHSAEDLGRLVGVNMSGMACASFQHQMARRWFEKEARRGERSQSFLRAAQAAAAGFVAYLRQHGREEAAAFYAQDIQRALKWAEDFRNQPREQEPWMRGKVRVAALLGAAWTGGAAAVMLGVGVLAVILSLTTGWWREPKRRGRGGYLEWLLLLLIPLAAGALLILKFASRAAAVYYLVRLGLWGSLALAGAILAWMVAVWIVTLRKRAVLPPDERPPKSRQYLAGLRALVPPTVAALVLMSVVSLWVARARADSYDARCREILMEMR